MGAALCTSSKSVTEVTVDGPATTAPPNSGSHDNVVAALLREELAALELEWATEREILLEQLRRKDTTIWSLVSHGEMPAQGLEPQAAAAAAAVSGNGTNDSDADEATAARRYSMHAVAAIALERAEAEAAERAWREGGAVVASDESAGPISEVCTSIGHPRACARKHALALW